MRTNPPIHRNDTNYRDFLDDVHKVLRGNVSIYDNLKGSLVSGTVTPGVADTEFAIAHNLGFVPTDYKVTSIDKAGIVYKSGTAWTATQAFFKCNVVTATVNIFVFG